MKATRWRTAIAVGVVLLAGLTGCSGSSSTETVKAPRFPRYTEITLNGIYGPENVGILMAKERGYFDEAHLEVNLRFPVSPDRPVIYVSDHAVEFSISHEPEIVLAHERGRPVVAVGSLISRPTAAMIWLKESKIRNIADLKGRTIATPGLRFQKSLLESILARAGLTLADVKIKPVGYELVPTLLSGKADAVFGGSWNLEGTELEARGAKPVITKVQDLGIPPYEELMLIANSNDVAKGPVRRLLAAIARGTAAAIKEPEAAMRRLAFARGEQMNKTLRAEVEATLPLLSESGEMNPDQASRLVEWMHGEGLIQGEPSAPDLFTNDYLRSEIE
jgi:putative hydroxymethylpyrimidine transport system substrate-binding protein